MNNIKKIFIKRAFTLVELLAVIIILGIILALAVPRVTNIINKYREKAYDIQLDNIVTVAKEYNLLYGNEIKWICSRALVSLGEFQAKGLLTDPVKNPKGGIFDATETIVMLKKKDNGFIEYTLNTEGDYLNAELQFEDLIGQEHVEQFVDVFIDYTLHFKFAYSMQTAGFAVFKLQDGVTKEYWDVDDNLVRWENNQWVGEFTANFEKGDQIRISLWHSGSPNPPLIGTVIIREDNSDGCILHELDINVVY